MLPIDNFGLCSILFGYRLSFFYVDFYASLDLVVKVNLQKIFCEYFVVN